jgi:hypothetical protein
MEGKSVRKNLEFSGKSEDFACWKERFMAYLSLKELDKTLLDEVVIPDEPSLPNNYSDEDERNVYYKAFTHYHQAVLKLTKDRKTIWYELILHLDKQSVIFLKADCRDNGTLAWAKLSRRFLWPEKRG